MKKTALFSLFAVMAVCLSASVAKATIIAGWTFESLATNASSTGISPAPVASPTPGFPGFPVPITPEIGTGSATALHASTASVWSDPAGNPQFTGDSSIHSLSANHYGVGDYFQFSAPGNGSLNYYLQFDQTGSATGPRDFKVQYSTDGSTFIDLNSYSLPSPAVSWNTSTYVTTTTFTGSTPTLGSAPATIYFRLTDNSTTAINGTTVATGGTGRVDNVFISDVPEPASFALIGLGMIGFLGAARYRKVG